MAILKELALDETGDLAVQGGSLVVVSGAQAVAQRVQSRLRTIKGEWVFDKTLGTPWFQDILGGRARNRLGLIHQRLRDRVAESQGVERVVDLKLGFDAETRGLDVTGQAIAEGGEPVPVGIEFIG